MAKYNISVQEIKQKCFEVEAETLTEAIASVIEDYKNGTIELTNAELKQIIVSQFANSELWDNNNMSVTLS